MRNAEVKPPDPASQSFIQKTALLCSVVCTKPPVSPCLAVYACRRIHTRVRTPGSVAAKQEKWGHLSERCIVRIVVTSKNCIVRWRYSWTDRLEPVLGSFVLSFQPCSSKVFTQWCSSPSLMLGQSSTAVLGLIPIGIAVSLLIELAQNDSLAPSFHSISGFRTPPTMAIPSARRPSGSFDRTMLLAGSIGLSGDT